MGGSSIGLCDCTSSLQRVSIWGGTYNWLHTCSCKPLLRPLSTVSQVAMGF